ncbi:MAG: histidine phosphatase family protein [Cyanobacteria bacterium P01_A01_bin.17]
MKLQCFNPNAAPTRVILVRHGRSTYNDQGRYQGSSDESVLTAQGRQDAFQTGLALKGISFSACYVSPLLRTQQTAQEISAAFKFSRRSPVPINVHCDLKEIDLPRWEGLSYRHVQETLTDDYRCWIERPHTFEMLPQTGAKDVSPRRPVQDLYAQARRFWRQVLPRHAGQTILVVSHGGTIKALLSQALGIPSHQFHTLQQSNCGISVLNFPYQQSACLEGMNDTSHLGEILPKLKAGRQGLRLLLVPDTGVPDLQPELLDQMEITFSVSNGESAQRLAKMLLAQNPQAVQLQTNRTDIPHLWLQALNKRQISGQVGTEMLTGLMVAKSEILQEMLSQVLGADPSLSQGLSLAAGRVNVVHYAKSQPLPILQAMNFADFALSQRGSMLCAS